jgi:hypothetical protein
VREVSVLAILSVSSVASPLDATEFWFLNEDSRPSSVMIMASLLRLFNLASRVFAPCAFDVANSILLVEPYVLYLLR